VNLQLSHEALAVRLHRARTDAVAAGNLLVRLAVRDAFEHIALAAGEKRELRPARASRPDSTRSASARRTVIAGLNTDYPTIDRAHRVAELVWRRVLAQVAVRAGAHGLQHVLRLIVHAQDEHARRGRAPRRRR
jgi:hypothetical protein